MYDYVNEHGILVHKYGPHTFHTNKKKLYDYICKYENWINYRLYCGAVINGKCTPVPFNFQTIDDFYTKEKAILLKNHIKKEFKNRYCASILEVLSSKDPVIKEYGYFLFKNDYSLYTAKQWGIPANQIDPCVLERVFLRFSYEEGYFEDTYQVLPKTSYVSFFNKLLDHNNIDVRLKVDVKSFIKLDRLNKKCLVQGKEIPCIVYTGPIDELFDYCYGKLPYRSLRFEWKNEKLLSKQKYAVIAYPQEESFTRIVEYKKLPIQNSDWTTYEIEYPLNYEYSSNFEPYYPVLTQHSNCLLKKYKKEVNLISNLFVCGRLGDFKYYNMDETLERALKIANIIK